MSKKVEIEVAGKKVTVSNLDKLLYPAAGFTKRQVIDYCLMNDLPALVWAANLADLELQVISSSYTRCLTDRKDCGRGHQDRRPV